VSNTDFATEDDVLSRMSPAASPMRPPPILTRVELGPMVLAHLDGGPVIVPAAQMLPPVPSMKTRIELAVRQKFPGATVTIDTRDALRVEGGQVWSAAVALSVATEGDYRLDVVCMRPTLDEALNVVATLAGVL
jgi:hypothetical protein